MRLNDELSFLMAEFERWKKEATWGDYVYLEIDVSELRLPLIEAWMDILYQKGFERILTFSKNNDAAFLLVSGWDRYYGFSDIDDDFLSFNDVEEIQLFLSDFYQKNKANQVLSRYCSFGKPTNSAKQRKKL